MTSQLSLLFGQQPTEARARNSDPDTSHEAAESVRTSYLEALVLEKLRECPEGATSFELAEMLGLSLVTVSPRLKPLVNKGLVVDSGTRRTGENGRKRTIWKVKGVEKGESK